MEGLPKDIVLYIFVIASERHNMARTLVQLNKVCYADKRLKMLAVQEAKKDVVEKVDKFLDLMPLAIPFRIVRTNTTMVELFKSKYGQFFTTLHKHHKILRDGDPSIPQTMQVPFKIKWGSDNTYITISRNIWYVWPTVDIWFTRVVVDYTHSRIVFIEKHSKKRAREESNKGNNFLSKYII